MADLEKDTPQTEEERTFGEWLGQQHYQDNTSSTLKDESTLTSPWFNMVPAESPRLASSSGERTPESLNSGKRLRVNVSRTTKGAISFEATVEMQACPGEGREPSIEDMLAESDRLVRELDSRYPVKE